MNLLKNRPVILSLTLALSALVGFTAIASDPSTVIDKAQRLAGTVATKARYLSQGDLQRIEGLLDQAREIALGRRNPSPRGPGRNPPQSQSECQLLGVGTYNGYRYKYRISLNGTAFVGSDDMTEILSKLSNLENDGMCYSVASRNCDLAGVGTYNGYRYKFRVNLDETSVAGSDELSEAIASLESLRNANVCERNRAEQACQVLGVGVWNGYRYQYRIGLGSTAVYGSDDYESMKQALTTLKNARVCY